MFPGQMALEQVLSAKYFVAYVTFGCLSSIRGVLLMHRGHVSLKKIVASKSLSTTQPASRQCPPTGQFTRRLRVLHSNVIVQCLLTLILVSTSIALGSHFYIMESRTQE